MPADMAEDVRARLTGGEPGTYNMGNYYIHVSPVVVNINGKYVVAVETSLDITPSHNVNENAEVREDEDEGFAADGYTLHTTE
ncbi:hypothetical protein GGI19_000867 [Coemansia pectinata]|uniref:Uncharacterized protein n=1 Tax=Coemansia pectinata TaxID=1052879 RepID=A0A9W8GYQ8_9FUNG|nr:hypothetical protein GGI19_000867 [Coemansia pectinata]